MCTGTGDVRGRSVGRPAVDKQGPHARWLPSSSPPSPAEGHGVTAPPPVLLPSLSGRGTRGDPSRPPPLPLRPRDTG